jgi:hypothetical protein
VCREPFGVSRDEFTGHQELAHFVGLDLAMHQGH